MRTLGIAAVIVAALFTGVDHASAHESSREWVPCEYEDSVDCVWDARHMGNGFGQSFKVGPKGHVTYISHRRAHHLLMDHPA